MPLTQSPVPGSLSHHGVRRMLVYIDTQQKAVLKLLRCMWSPQCFASELLCQSSRWPMVTQFQASFSKSFTPSKFPCDNLHCPVPTHPPNHVVLSWAMIVLK